MSRTIPPVVCAEKWLFFIPEAKVNTRLIVDDDHAVVARQCCPERDVIVPETVTPSCEEIDPSATGVCGRPDAAYPDDAVRGIYVQSIQRRICFGKIPR